MPAFQPRWCQRRSDFTSAAAFARGGRDRRISL